jgi:hypothetical protein
MFHNRDAYALPDLINTPLQRGVGDSGRVETVSTVSTHWGKPLKRFPREFQTLVLRRSDS